MDNLSCKYCGKKFPSVRARCGHTRIHFPPCVAQESVPWAAVLVALGNARPAAIFDLNGPPNLMEHQENGSLPDLNVVPAVMGEAQGNGRVPDLNMLPEPEDDQV